MKRFPKNIFDHVFFLPLFLLFFLHPLSVYPQDDLTVSQSTDDALEEELRYLKAETYVITASRIPENIKKSASSITVITDKQIREMGARNLADVIKRVPGMNYYYNSYGVHRLGVRGDIRNFQNAILVMINGHPLNENFSGGATYYTYDTMVLDNVKRIEVIRGPGSALYGANAFEGVINIITKDPEDVDGWELTVGGGSYDTQQYNLLYGKTFNDLEIAFNYNYFNTHGFNKHVDEDGLSTSNQIRRKISLAPERVRGDDDKYDVSLNLKYKGFTFDGKYLDRERDFPVGTIWILNNRSKNFVKDYYLTISYERTLWEDLDLSGKVYRNHNRFRDEFQALPPSILWFTNGPSWVKNGEIEGWSTKNNRTGFELLTIYRISDSHKLVGGMTYEEIKQFDVNRRANFLYPPPLTVPLLSVRDLSNIQNHNRSVKRNFKALFIEDIWDITDDLRLTLGIRWDDYSDFGSEVSPRAGLTWEFKKGYDLKLLYGHAFRAPNFYELYNVKVGNPDLDPETIDTYEISLGAEITSSLGGRLTFYHNEGDDLVDEFFNLPVIRLKNHNKMRSQGLEVEAKYDFGRGTYLAVNYTYQRWISPHTRDRNWLMPRHLGNVMANIRLSKYLNFYASCHIEDGFRRDRGDTRDDMSGFAVVNATLIAKKFLKGYENLELRGSVYNLFDKDYTYPEVPNMPNDMPQPGRNFFVEVKYKF